MVLALVAVAVVPARTARVASKNASMTRVETAVLIPLTIADAGEAETEDGLLPYRHVVRRQEEKVRQEAERALSPPGREMRQRWSFKRGMERDGFQEGL